MKRGDTFLMGSPRGGKKHLYSVISDPAKAGLTLVTVNVTTPDPKSTQACLVTPAEHPWLDYPSAVNFGDALHVTAVASIPALIASGVIVPQKSVSQAVVDRIVAAARRSPALPRKLLPFL